MPLQPLLSLSVQALTLVNALSSDWQLEPWLFKDERGESQKPSNIANVVQELIDSNTWVPVIVLHL